MKKWIHYIAIITLGIWGNTTTLHATPYYQDITRVGTSAEMIGIGNVQGFSEQASVLLENPAGLSYAGNSFSAFYTSYFEGTQYLTSGISFQSRPDLSLGIAAAYEYTDGLDATGEDNNGEYTSLSQFTFSKTQIVAGFDYRLAEKLHIGAAWSQYLSSIKDIKGIGSDLTLGVRFTTNPATIMLTGKNVLGNKIEFNDDTSEKLPAEWSLGFKSIPTPFLDSILFGQVKKIDGISNTLKSVGIRLHPLTTSALSINLGYNEKPAVSSAKSTLTAGLNLNLSDFSIHYAYDTTDVYQNTQQHYVSFKLKY